MIEQHLQRLGFKEVCQIGSSHIFNHYRAIRRGKPHFIKAAKTPAGADFLCRETAYADLLTRLGLPAGACVLQGELCVETGDVFCIFPFVEGRWLGAQRPDRMLFEPDTGLQQILAGLERVHASVTADMVGECYGAIKYDAAEHMRRGYVSEVESNLGANISRDTLETERAWAAKQTGAPTRFQHCDIMPPNLCWLNDGRLLLVDAQFSGPRMKWWDAAYFFIQTYVFFRRPELAKSVLRHMLDEFAADGIREDILRPLRYRATINLAVASGESVPLAKQLWQRVQTEDLNEILR